MYRITFWFFLALAGTSQAGVITQSQNFNISSEVSNGVANAVGVNVFNTFDTSLGQLDSVDLQITGTILGRIRFPGLVVPGPPVPVLYDIELQQSFGGIQFALTPTRFYSGQGLAGTELDILILYRHTMTFNRTLDGFTPITTTGGFDVPPAFATNLMADFESNIGFPLFILPTLSITPNFIVPIMTTIGDVNSVGVIEIEYNFTESPIPVPEPGTLGLLGAGLLGLAFRRKKAA